jgi:hypothetical protein
MTEATQIIEEPKVKESPFSVVPPTKPEGEKRFANLFLKR